MKFKTNINCGGCVAKVTPALNEILGANNWNVDIQNPEKVLTVGDTTLSAEEIKHLVQSAGFNIEAQLEK